MSKKLTYEEVVKRISSTVKLICKVNHEGVYMHPEGLYIIPYKYKEGDILPRTNIVLFPDNWELAQEELEDIEEIKEAEGVLIEIEEEDSALFSHKTFYQP